MLRNSIAIGAGVTATRINQIAIGIQTMYAELEERRALSGNNHSPDLAAKLSEQEHLIATLTNERDQAQAAHQKSQAQATSSTQEVSALRQKLNKMPQPVSSKELIAFFPTVTLKDANSEDAFLSSKRRQRRLMQRLRAEGFTIMRFA